MTNFGGLDSVTKLVLSSAMKDVLPIKNNAFACIYFQFLIIFTKQLTVLLKMST